MDQMLTLKHVDVLPAAKIGSIISGVIGLITGVLVFIFSSLFSVAFHGPHSLAVFGVGAASIIILPIALLIVGFVCTAIEAWLYNIVANKIGGVKVDLTKNRLNRIDPSSMAKIYAVCGLIVGFVIGLVISIVSVFASVFAGPYALVGIAAVVIVPLLFAVCGFIFIYIVALLYNYIATKIGGVAIWLKAREVKKVGPLSYAKIEGTISVIFGIIAGIINAAVSIAATGTVLPVAGIGLGILAIILYPIFYFVIGFISTLFAAWLYNKLVPKIGAIKVTLSK